MSTYNEYHVDYNRRLPTFFFSPLFQQLSCITRRRHRQVSLSLEALADFFFKTVVCAAFTVLAPRNSTFVFRVIFSPKINTHAMLRESIR